MGTFDEYPADHMTGWLPNWDMVDTCGIRLNQREMDALKERRTELIRWIDRDAGFTIGARARYLQELSALNKVLAA